MNNLKLFPPMHPLFFIFYFFFINSKHFAIFVHRLAGLFQYESANSFTDLSVM